MSEFTFEEGTYSEDLMDNLFSHQGIIVCSGCKAYETGFFSEKTQPKIPPGAVMRVSMDCPCGETTEIFFKSERKVCGCQGCEEAALDSEEYCAGHKIISGSGDLKTEEEIDQIQVNI